MDLLVDKMDTIHEKQIELLDIQPKELENKEFLINNKLIVNSEEGNLLNELKKDV